MCHAVFLPNCFDHSQREVIALKPGVSFADWLADSGFEQRLRQQPLYIVKNGDELLERDFHQPIHRGDIILLTVLPEATAIATVVAYIAANWVTIAMIVAVALMTPGAPEPDLPNEAAQTEGSPTYQLSARGNRARIGQPIPVLYGSMRTYPDLSARPYTVFENGEDMILYQLFEITQGYADVEFDSIRFEDTPLSSFEDYEVEVVAPGEQSNLYPADVVTSDEVSSLALEDSELGPYTVNAVDTEVTRIQFDMVAPSGIFNQNAKNGDLRRYAVSYRFSARLLDDDDQPAGDWFVLVEETISGSNRDPIRRSHSYAVEAERYEVKVRRLTPTSDSIYDADTLQWYQLKGFLNDKTVSNTTRLSIKIRASEQIGNKALQEMSAVSHRRLPIWHPVTGWSEPQPTNNLVWAFADACRAAYGGNRADTHIDLPTLKRLETLDLAFNGVFDTAGTLWDALTKIAQAGRCMPVDKAGVYTLVADRYSEVPVQMFTMRNIVRDSFSIQHVGVLQETSDAVRVTYWDREKDYKPKELLCTLPGSPALNPRDVTLFGVTDKETAFNNGMYLAAQNQYRRALISFQTGIEGRIPFYGDVIVVSHFMLGVEGTPQVSGEVVAFNGVDVLTLSESIDPLADPYIQLRKRDGSPTTAYHAQVLSARQVRLLDPFTEAGELSFDVGYERTHFAAGEGNAFTARVKVTKVDPEGQGRIRIEGFVDDPTVYTAADGLEVPPIDDLPGAENVAPVVSNLTAYLSGTPALPIVTLSWEGKRSDRYLIEYAMGASDTWIRAGVGFTRETHFEDRPQPGVIRYRVAGENIFRGAWQSVTVDTDQVLTAPPPAPTQLMLRDSFTGDTLKLQWESITSAHRLVFIKNDQEKYGVTIEGTTFDLAATVARQQGLGREFIVEVYAVSLTGTLSETPATLTVRNEPPAPLNNLVVLGLKNTAMVTFDWPTDPDLVGVSVWLSEVDGFTPRQDSRSVDKSLNPVIGIAIEHGKTYYLRAAAVDAWGNDEVNYSGQYTVTSSLITATEITPEAIKTPHLAANVVTADKTFINTLSAITANLGVATAGTFKTSASTRLRAEMSSEGNFPLWIGNGTKNSANARLAFNKNTDTLELRGVVVYDDNNHVLLSSGAGMDYGALSGIPLSLGDLNSNEGGKLAGIAAGADVTKNNTAKAITGQGAFATVSKLTASNISTYMANAAIGRALIGSAAIGTAQIGNAAVDTLNIAGQAVTFPVSAFTAADMDLVGNDWVEVQAITFTSPVAPMEIVFSCIYTRGQITVPGGAVRFRLVYDNTVLLTSPAIYRSDTEALNGPITFTFTHTPGSGVRRYVVEMVKVSGDAATVSHRHLRALGLKDNG